MLLGIEAKSDEALGPRIGPYLAKADIANRGRRAAGKRVSNLPERIRLLRSWSSAAVPWTCRDNAISCCMGSAER